MKNYLPLAVLLVLHVIFLWLDLYKITHLDSVMHLAGGIALAMCLYGVLASAMDKGWCPDPGKLVSAVLVISLVTTGAVCWEFYEWISDRVFGTVLQPSVNDTVKDLLLGLLGGVLYTGANFVAHAPAYGLSRLRADVAGLFRC
ncbi:MAG TPA: hypothetical protein VLB10_10220 [Gammaproteobacteria bacterium]|jgi:hypothetical protein|nr:hypothetical protein [Gammaproteobacteria bacterium]